MQSAALAKGEGGDVAIQIQRLSLNHVNKKKKRGRHF